MWSDSNSVISVGDPDSGGVIVPVSDVTIQAVPRADGSTGTTVTELYDGRLVFSPPVFRVRAEFSWGNWRTEYKPARHGTPGDVVRSFLSAPEGKREVWFERGDSRWNTQRRVDDMLLDMSEEMIQAAFEGRMRQKPSSFTLVSSRSDLSFDQIEWIL